jgi:hypothetical protein
MAVDRQRPHTDSCFFDHDDAALPQSLMQKGQIWEQQSHLSFRASLGSTSKKEHGGRAFPLQGKESGKIGVRRDDHAAFLFRTDENGFIGRFLHFVIANMSRVVSVLTQTIRDNWR